MSSNKTTTTFGAPLGAVTENAGGAFASRASSVVIVDTCGSGTGNTVRSSATWARVAIEKLAAAAKMPKRAERDRIDRLPVPSLTGFGRRDDTSGT
jgi:hypothetical protein